MKLNNIPIQEKLMRVMLLTSGAVLLLTYACYFIYELVTFRQVTQAQLSTIAKIVATNSTAALAFDDPREGTEILQALQAERYIVVAGLYDDEGHLFSRYPDTLAAPAFPDTPTDNGYVFTASHLEGFEPVIQGNKRLGTLYVKLSMDAMYQRLQLYGLIAFGMVGISFLLAYSLSRTLQKVISGPILSLAETARVVSQEFDYSVRAQKSGNDELGLLTDAFNNMLTRIEEQNHEIRQFNHSLEQKVRERTLELELANQELKKKNEFVETIIDSSVHVIAVLDRDLRYTTINRKFEQIYKVNREDILGKCYTDLFPQTVGSSIHRDVLLALQGQTSHSTVTQSAIIPGYFETYCVPLKEGEEVYGALLVGHDITSIMEANEKLKVANEELVKSNIDLEQFAYVASHDLQEPLRKIQVFTDLIRSRRHDEEQTAVYLDKVHSAAERMTFLIRDLLSYSRLSRSEEGFMETDLNATIETVKSDFEMLIQQKAATIIYKDLPVVKGIPHQLGQLFSNLISNAIKFSQENPEIRITANQLPPGSNTQYGPLPAEHPYWAIQVSDNGIGFDPRYSQKIFTIFQRLNDQKKYSGTGIGLAICRKIVENHQGTIVAQSTPGQGATFTVLLPVHSEAITTEATI
ncbi:ATP-binding protein [Telluribacter sp. SYSU D00476]|uniref:ATP-binding protein n=1 Tax=Telluribacter sp. SYSU D00476 TaxID=2811430 RepID=UPI001FF6E4E3|nr:ATP-binding protein [Telluribacter sp. SYSU D00476]